MRGACRGRAISRDVLAPRILTRRSSRDRFSGEADFGGAKCVPRPRCLERRARPAHPHTTLLLRQVLRSGELRRGAVRAAAAPFRETRSPRASSRDAPLATGFSETRPSARRSACHGRAASRDPLAPRILTRCSSCDRFFGDTDFREAECVPRPRRLERRARPAHSHATLLV